MVTKVLERRLSIRQMVYLTIAGGIPYIAIGVIWLITHDSHLSELTGLDRLLSAIGEIIAWPVLIIADIQLR
ncbi:hypothetical protein AB0G00_00150 [Nocardia salmonicida]|uniref:hypothetical protein n=1 Tax=Nocardia TaxID=1817 RepID=UPI0026589676|nr:hypothetical protein [Nocardia sp. PE-7]WKG06871.1 hypothetical protein QX204_17270 [Nocardia sp. PE-7]